MLEIISATRLSEADFWEKSALGASLKRLYRSEIVSRIAFANRHPLPVVYNHCLSIAPENDPVAFIHDDIWIDDIFFADRVLDGLDKFNIIGVAGNRRRQPRQSSWAFIGPERYWDDETNFSGAIAHGDKPFGPISFYGETPAECESLDGVFLATRKSTLRKYGVQFDPRFSFHFYDMDFCRSARKAGLRLATWPICLTHQGDGKYESEEWNDGYRKYIAKWAD